LASAFGTRGLCTDVVREVMTNHELLVSTLVLQELTRTLTEKFLVPTDDVKAITDSLMDYCVTSPGPVAPAIALRDPNDVQIVAAAIEGHADVLVTGDKDILTAKSQLPLKVADPREFWTLLKTQHPTR
jgi:putative PIN family toxin of toxin-antitoxin system